MLEREALLRRATGAPLVAVLPGDPAHNAVIALYERKLLFVRNVGGWESRLTAEGALALRVCPVDES